MKPRQSGRVTATELLSEPEVWTVAFRDQRTSSVRFRRLDIEFFPFSDVSDSELLLSLWDVCGPCGPRPLKVSSLNFNVEVVESEVQWFPFCFQPLHYQSNQSGGLGLGLGFRVPDELH